MAMFRRLADFPRVLVIGESIWTVKFVRQIPDGDPCDIGYMVPGDETIYIKMGLSPRERLRTYLHEVLHCIEYELDITLPHDLIDALDEMLMLFIMENFTGHLPASREAQIMIPPKAAQKIRRRLQRRFPNKVS